MTTKSRLAIVFGAFVLMLGLAAPAASAQTTAPAAPTAAPVSKADVAKAKKAAKKAAAKAKADAKRAAKKAKADKKKFLASLPIFEQSGSGTATTAKFKVPNNWDLVWTYDCGNTPFGGTGNFITMNYDLTGSFGGSAESGGNLDFDNQGINQLGANGAGVEHYHSGGNTKYIKVISECDWTMKVTRG